MLGTNTTVGHVCDTGGRRALVSAGSPQWMEACGAHAVANQGST